MRARFFKSNLLFLRPKNGFRSGLARGPTFGSTSPHAVRLTPGNRRTANHHNQFYPPHLAVRRPKGKFPLFNQTLAARRPLRASNIAVTGTPTLCCHRHTMENRSEPV